jgi:hypothetical protein
MSHRKEKAKIRYHVIYIGLEPAAVAITDLTHLDDSADVHPNGLI